MNDVPQKQPDLWMQHVRQGDFEAAWKITDAHIRSGALQPHAPVPRHLQRVWIGAPL